MIRANLRSLRHRVLLIVVVVVVLPLASVWIAGTFESSGGTGLRRTVEVAATRGVRALDGDLDRVARTSRVWLRVVAADAVVADHDHTVGVILEPVADPFFGPDGVPDPRDLDAQLGPLPDRPEVRSATTTAQADCRLGASGLMLMCTATARASDGRVVHVFRGSPRLVRSLYEERFQLTALTLAVLVVGLLLAWWLGFTMVTPIVALRNQVVARTQRPMSSKPVVVGRRDEIGDLAAAFNDLLAALQEQNRANATFAADLAHELKNPVAAVRAAAEAMAADREVQGERRSRLQRVLANSSGRMEAVVDRFLELARAEAGLPGVSRESVDVAELVAGVVQAFAHDERYTGVTFDVHALPATVRAASERLETALRNLIGNAAHFAHPHGTVQVGVRSTEHDVHVSIRDTGPGIEQGDLARIFDRYVSTRQGGTGLGLPLVHAIAQAHGGAVHVVSTVGEGATFTLTLPRERTSDR